VKQECGLSRCWLSDLPQWCKLGVDSPPQARKNSTFGIPKFQPISGEWIFEYPFPPSPFFCRLVYRRFWTQVWNIGSGDANIPAAGERALNIRYPKVLGGAWRYSKPPLERQKCSSFRRFPCYFAFFDHLSGSSQAWKSQTMTQTLTN